MVEHMLRLAVCVVEGEGRPASLDESNQHTWTAGIARAPGRLLQLMQQKGASDLDDSAKESVATSSDPLQDKGHTRCLLQQLCHLQQCC